MTAPHTPNSATPDDPTLSEGDGRASRPWARRQFLLGAGTLLVAAGCAKEAVSTATTDGASSTTTTAAGTSTTAAASASTTAGTATTAAAASGFTAADFTSAGTCQLLPEKTAGPFPLDQQLVRRDITEGYDGQALRLGFRVVDAKCAPVTGSSVEIWHCDATGDYSAFIDNGGGKDEGPGTTFLRGTQPVNSDGICEFATIVPGWYKGRAVHIHLRVHVDDKTVATSQLFFQADQLATVYANAPYAANGLPDTSNETDSIAGDPKAEGTLLTMASASGGKGSQAVLNLAVDPTATSGGSGGPGA